MDHDPGKYHLAFLCLLTPPIPQVGHIKDRLSGDFSHCYAFGRAYGFKVTGRLIPPEAAFGAWGPPVLWVPREGLAEGEPGLQRG